MYRKKYNTCQFSNGKVFVQKLESTEVIVSESKLIIHHIIFNMSTSEKYEFTPIEKALDDFKKGGFVVVMDNEDRENEGDLIAAAQFMTQEKMAFLVRHSSGYVCLPISEEKADKLELPLMTTHSTDRHGTAYTITTDAKENTTTGISAHDRALTALKIADPNAKPSEFLRPGHCLPLRARNGLLRARQGHTEASVQLCQLTGLEPAATICELVRDEDGLMMRLPDTYAFCKKYNVNLITIGQILKYMDDHNL